MRKNDISDDINGRQWASRFDQPRKMDLKSINIGILCRQSCKVIVRYAKAAKYVVKYDCSMNDLSSALHMAYETSALLQQLLCDIYTKISNIDHSVDDFDATRATREWSG